jgi:Leucine Rich repeats (2 copies)
MKTYSLLLTWMSTGYGEAAASIFEENKLGYHWESLPQDVHAAIDAYVGMSALRFKAILSHRSFKTFLGKFSTLSASASENEAVASFYKHNKEMLDAVLSHPYFRSEECLLALWSDEPLPASEAIQELYATCNAYLRILRSVDAKLAPCLTNPQRKILSLLDTPVTDLSRLSGLTGLKELYLDRTRVTDLSPLSGLTGLNVLILNGTPVTDFSPLSGLTGLKVLLLNGTPLTDLSPLSGLTGLEVLYLESTPVTDLSPLSGLTGLKDLSLRYSLVTDLSPLSGLTGLKELYLYGTPVTDLSPLSGLTGLEKLYFHGTPEDLSVLAHLTNLRIIG